MKSSAFLMASLLVSSCAHSNASRPPRDIKVYKIYSDNRFCDAAWCQGKTGLVRKQDKEVKPFSESNDYIAVSPEDFKRILDRCPK